MENIAKDADRDREQLKREIKDEIVHEERRRRFSRWLRKACVAAIVVGGLSFFTLATIAKTGIVEVGPFTAWFFRPASPIRVVRPSRDTDPQHVIRVAAYSAKFDPATRLVTLRLTEAELTTIVDAAFRQGTSGRSFVVERAQVAIDPDTTQLFAEVAFGTRRTTMLAEMRPAYEDGAIRLHTSKIAVGSFIMPKAIVGLIEKRLEEEAAKAYREGLSKAGELVGIVTDTGAVSVTLNPAVR